MAEEEPDKTLGYQTNNDEASADDFAESGDAPTADLMRADEHDDQANGNGNEAPNQEPSFAIDYDALPVDLHFEIARQSSTVEELSQLKVGSVIDLGKTPESLVSIYANGRHVATAELVMVDGKVGVRIKSRDR